MRIWRMTRFLNPKRFTLVGAILLAALCAESALSEGTPVYGYKIVNTYPHDRGAFTQGLLFHDGILYESTGRKGFSGIREVDLKTGEVIKSQDLADRYFGEGICVVNGKIVQLTWTSETGFVYDMPDLKPVGTFDYKGEGWGLTYDGKHLIKSNGSSVLKFLDPKSFKVAGELEVYDENGAVGRLNELEYIEGEIFANIWAKDLVARIDPGTGRVTGWIDLSGLLSEEDRKKHVDVLNGIAYDSRTKKLFVTGKLWPKLFEIEIVSKEDMK